MESSEIHASGRSPPNDGQSSSDFRDHRIPSLGLAYGDPFGLHLPRDVSDNDRPTNSKFSTYNHIASYRPVGIPQDLPLPNQKPSTFPPIGTAFQEQYGQYVRQENTWISKFLNENLDVMLVFAGLFSAVVTAFLVESTKLLQPDSAEVSVSLLLTIARFQQQLQTNITFNREPVGPVDVPTFSVPRYAIAVNVLWFLALSLSLAAALLSLLAKEWLKHYEHHSSNDPSSRLLEHQKKLDAMNRWYGFEVIDLIPVLLHISLFLFGSGLVVYLWGLSLAVSLVTLAIFAAAGLFYIITVLLAAFTDSTPFVTRVSRYIKLAVAAGRQTWGQLSANSDAENIPPFTGPAASSLLPVPDQPGSQPCSEVNQILKQSENQSYDSKTAVQALIWVYDVAGDKAADSIIEVMSTMRFAWDLEYSRRDKREINRARAYQITQPSSLPVFLRSLGRGGGQPHQSIRLYNMTSKRLEELVSGVQLHEKEVTSVGVTRCAEVLVNLCMYICSRSVGWSDWSGNKTMSVLINARGILNSIWGRDYGLLSSNACASITAAELKLMFLISSCLNDGSKWRSPNNTLDFHPDSFREVITFYNSKIARATIQLMRHSDGAARLDIEQLVGLTDAIVQSTNCIAGLISNISSPTWPSHFQEIAASDLGATAKSQLDVALEKGPLTMTIPVAYADPIEFTLYPIDYGLSGELARIIFSTEHQLEPKILAKVGLALRSILEVLFNRAGFTHRVPVPPSEYEWSHMSLEWTPDLEFMDINVFSTGQPSGTDERSKLHDQIFQSWPWPMQQDQGKSLDQQMAGQILTIAALFTLHTGPNQLFKRESEARLLMQVAVHFEQRVTNDWPGPFLWQLIRASYAQAMVNRGTARHLQLDLLGFISKHMTRLDIQTLEELKIIFTLLVNVRLEYDWQDGHLLPILESLADTSRSRSLIHEHWFHTTEGIPSFLLLAHNQMLCRPITSFIAFMFDSVTNNSGDSESSKILDNLAVDSLLLAINFVLSVTEPGSADFTSSLFPFWTSSSMPQESESLAGFKFKRQTFARSALSLLEGHETSPLDNAPEKREGVHKGLQDVWRKIRGGSAEILDLSLESVKGKLQAVTDEPAQPEPEFKPHWANYPQWKPPVGETDVGLNASGSGSNADDNDNGI